jgi:hypothetical protein
MGNMASRQRMRRDTSMQDDLPPRCLALATGEIVPNGHSNNARMFLVAGTPLSDDEIRAHGHALTEPQQRRLLYRQAMTLYLQWIAQHWTRLATALPARLAALRTEAVRVGCHAREPGQVAYLQLAWETFTQCAVDHHAICPVQRQAILIKTWAMFLTAVTEHATVLRREQTVQRFFDYLRDGFASNKIYLRALDGEMPEDPATWGWTPTTVWNAEAKEHVPTYEPRQASLLGHVDDDSLYLIPKALEQYLHQAAKAESRAWPADMTSLLRELQAIGAIDTRTDAKTGRLYRELQKKIQGVNQRRLFLHRAAVQMADEGAEEEDPDVPF